MPTSAILYHLSQTHLSLGDFQILSSWWGLFMDDSCAFGVGLNYFRVWGCLCLCMVGRCFLSWLHEEFANCFGSVGSQYLPWASFSKKLLYVWAQALYTRVLVCVWAHRDPVYPSCSCFILTVERNILMCSCSVALEMQLLPVML